MSFNDFISVSGVLGGIFPSNLVHFGSEVGQSAYLANAAFLISEYNFYTTIDILYHIKNLSNQEKIRAENFRPLLLFCCSP